MKKSLTSKMEVLCDEVDALIAEWPEDKLRMVIDRAKALLRRDAGRKPQSFTSNRINEAIHSAALNIRRLEDYNRIAAEKKGWTIAAIRAEIAASPDLKQNVSTERAIRRAIVTGSLKRIRAI